MTRVRWKKGLLGLTTAILLLLATWLVNLAWFRPFSIDHFYERFFIGLSLQHPQMVTQMSLLPGWAYWRNDELNSFTPERFHEDFRQLREALDMLRSYDFDSQSESQQLSTRIMEWFLDNAARAERFMFHDYPVNQMFGLQSSLASFMLESHQVTRVSEAEDYNARLREFARVFREVEAALRMREENGVLPPRFVFDHVIDEIEGFVSAPPAEHVFYTNLEEKLEQLDGVDESERRQLLDDARNAIADAVYPAYRGLQAYLEEARQRASDDDGAWKLPDGDDYYRFVLRNHTTTDLDPLEVHAIGLREVARIEAEMDAILAAEGLVEGSVGERMLALSKDPRFLFEDVEGNGEQVLESYRAIIAEIDAGIDTAFARRPRAKLEVRRLPEFYESTMPAAYYQPPARDGSRPGRFYINLREVGDIPKYGMRTLAFHEGIPGHHFQVALQAELDELPTFRSTPMFTAYIEGWGLYAEQLAAEMGYQQDPYDRLGYLQASLFRAVRLVVDTGIHASRWTRAEAIEYMQGKTGMPESEVVTEVERYIVLPGQACAYMIGKLKILELRERARKALGEAFDLREFHRVVLQGGAMPLSLLEEEVDKWIEASR